MKKVLCVLSLVLATTSFADTLRCDGVEVAFNYELTATQVKDTNGAPFTLITSPGLDKAILLLSYGEAIDLTSEAYEADVSALKVGSNDLLDINGAAVTTDILTKTSDWSVLYSGCFKMESASSSIANAAITWTPSLYTGSILTSSINAAGAGYSVNDMLTVTGGDGNAVLTVDTVGGGGDVLTYHFAHNDKGSGYSAASGVACTGGGGANFKINILTAGIAGDGVVHIFGSYRVIDAP